MSDIIPDELWRRILEIGVGNTPKLLEYKDLCCLSIASRRLNRLSNEDSLWSSLLSSDFPLNQNTPSAAAASSSSNISGTSANSSSKALYRIRFEKYRVRRLAAHRRAVLRIESQVAEHSRKLQEIQLRFVEETERVKATAAELSHLHKVRRASAALNVWQPEVVRGKHKQIVEQCVVPADSRIHALEMEIRLCKQQVASLDKANREERRRLDAAKEQLASIKYHPLADYSLTIHRLDEGGVKRKKLKKEHTNWLLRCSKSCRLRWTNYLRPGIKRGNFTPHEEGMIIHLQALLGNKWAAIASYLPQRTDNDIKNYWNTHLKKKIKKFQSSLDPKMGLSSDLAASYQFGSKTFFSDKRSTTFDITNSHSSSSSSSSFFSSSSSAYASSTENISRLLEGWMMRSSPNKTNANSSLLIGNDQKERVPLPSGTTSAPKSEFESILSFDNLSSAIANWEKSASDSTDLKGSSQTPSMAADDDDVDDDDEEKKKQRSVQNEDQIIINHDPPLMFLENWLLGEGAAGQVEEMMELPPIF